MPPKTSTCLRIQPHLLRDVKARAAQSGLTMSDYIAMLIRCDEHGCEQQEEASAAAVLPLPPTANNAYANTNRGRQLSRDADAWKKEAGWLIKAANLTATPPFALRLRLWVPDRRRRDVDNYIKLAKDALCGVLGIDDSWQNIPVVTAEVVGVDKWAARMEVFIDSSEQEL